MKFLAFILISVGMFALMFVMTQLAEVRGLRMV